MEYHSLKVFFFKDEISIKKKRFIRIEIIIRDLKEILIILLIVS